VGLAVARIGPRGLMGLIRIRFLAVILLIVLVVVLVLENFVALGDRLLGEPGPGVIWKPCVNTNFRGRGGLAQLRC
jgi:hypothetical protein